MLLKERITKRLYLRKIALSDAKDLYQISSDDEVVKYLSWKKHKSIDETKYIIKTFFQNKDHYGYAIIDKVKNVLIGLIDFVNIDFVNNRGEIGYVLSRDYWGQGIMVEAVNEMLDVGFNDLNLNRIAIGHYETNYNSKRVVEKCGFIFEGIERKSRKNINNSEDKELYYDCYIYALLKNEYKKLS